MSSLIAIQTAPPPQNLPYSYNQNLSLHPADSFRHPTQSNFTEVTSSPTLDPDPDGIISGVGVFGGKFGAADDISVLRWLQYMLVPTIVTLGVAANFLALIVYLASRLRRLSCSIYLAALAVTDSGFLLCLLTRWAHGVWMNSYGWSLCPVNYYLTGVFSFLSMAYVLGYTIERYLATCWPLQRKTWCTKRRAICVVVACLVFALVAFIPTLLMFEVRLIENQRGPHLQCAAKRDYETVLKWTSICAMCFFWLIPTLLTIFLNARIICKMASHDGLIRIHSSSNNAMKIRQPSRRQSPTTLAERLSTSSLGGSLANIDRCSNSSIKTNKGLLSSVNNNNGHNNGSYGSHRRSSYKITRMLVVSSSAFIVMGLPYEILKEYHYFSYDNWSLDDIINQDYSMTYKVIVFFVYHLYYLNYGVDFFIYNVAGKNFRMALSEVIHDVWETFGKVLTCRLTKSPSRV